MPYDEGIQPLLTFLIPVYYYVIYYIYYISVNIIQIAICLIYLVNQFIIRISMDNYRHWDNY